MANTILFFISIVISGILTYLFIRVVEKKGCPLDQPNKIKSHAIHKRAVPTSGGIPLFISFWILILFFTRWNIQLLYFFVFSLLLMLFGLLDDIKSLPAVLKLSFQAISGFFLYLIFKPTGFHLVFFSIPGGLASLFFTIFFFMVLVNGLNFLDGIDGLAGIYTTVLSLFLLLSYSDISRIPLFIFIGSLSGFLIWNIQSERVFLGDAGIYYISAILSFLLLSPKGSLDLFPFGLLFSIPLMDLGGAVLRRLKKGITPLAPDTEHIHHQLMKKIGSRILVLLIYTVSLAALGIIGIYVVKHPFLKYVLTPFLVLIWIFFLFIFKWL